MTSQTSGSPTSQIVRFAGDSGDGIQLQGAQFTHASALSGHDLATFPDFPAEIRAPAGTRFGVSAFQIQFGSNRVTTPGDAPDVLVAFNPAALVVNLPRLPKGALIIADASAFTEQRLRRADLDANPMEDGSLADYRVCAIDIAQLTLEAVKPFGLGTKDSQRCKNFWALGLVLWMFDQPREPTVAWIRARFRANQALLDANLAALNAGHAYGETAELGRELTQRHVPEAPLKAIEYRTITGAEALALGIVAAGELADTEVMFCSYPITPASSLLHHLVGLEDAGVTTYQAEDEIAAVCSAIGASYAGKFGITSSSGPGIALKTEALGLAVATELPLLVVNSQRAGPSTGMPTKTEQSDLYQAVYGRNADSPIPVIAARSPGDCFEVAIEASRIALRHMTPVILLTDGYIANASELWPLPDIDAFAPIPTNRPGPADTPESRPVYARDPATEARLWLAPGDSAYLYRVGGIEKDFYTGDISYEAANHQRMTDMRARKLARVADFIPDQTVELGDEMGLAVVAWGSTYGAVYQAVRLAREEGIAVAHIHLRHINPLPSNLGELLGRYDTVLVPELNTGQLATVLRDRLLINCVQINQVSGQPFAVSTLLNHLRAHATVRLQEVRHG
ncbi:MAG: 2-oxoacid:acceptor oxidoreductase subunit alpha [Pseudomonadales bacterium]|nr:2-oxoacid:acceptor oxidoreductase subunit alpha [Pseudomonadales bacterium]MCP5185279.1 2-oxoacid:acceptor oxidoreductase subunit alpha [Pseudomonadales bacterium]